VEKYHGTNKIIKTIDPIIIRAIKSKKRKKREG
jgi:hypothetical protein